MLALGLSACTEIFDFGRVVAIDVIGPADPTVEEGDTLRLAARAVSAAGDSVPEAVIVWEAVIPDSGTDVLTVDSAGLVTGLASGDGFVQARHETLTTPLISVLVTAQPDSVSADSTRFMVPAGDTAPTTLTVTVAAISDTGVVLIPLPDKLVRFRLVDPAGGSSVRLASSDGTPSMQPDSLDVETGATGTASALLQQVSGATLPDSAVVHAIAFTARADTVPGSPVRFVVAFP